jgi:hypothetical protein
MTHDPDNPCNLPKRLPQIPEIPAAEVAEAFPSYANLMACYGIDVLAGAPPKELEGGCTLHRPVFKKPAK